MNSAVVVEDAERSREWDREFEAVGSRHGFGTSTPLEMPGPRRGARPPRPRKVKYLRVDGDWVRRDGLFRQLSGAGDTGTILVCAPAGSGKSVLVGSWLEAEGLADRVAWTSVERDERDGQRFLASVVGALAALDGSVEWAAPAPGLRAELALDQLLSELSEVEEPIVMVIDDLHELRSAEALRWLERLVARQPSRLLAVLMSREDPGLGLHRLRLSGELTELRSRDLRFSLPETCQLVAHAGIRLSPDQVARLHERSEGWAAGLRLALISLAQHPEPERFVTEFCGGERTVAGYLLAEVFERQPAEVRELLLRTSVLNRVCGPLADYLVGASGSERLLKQLEDENAFVTSLDMGRSWFRYHQLFGELLQAELRRLAPATIAVLHRAAAQWHEQHGDVVEAIRHAQAGKDWGLAARLLADHHLSLLLHGQIAALHELCRAFTASAPAEDAELALVFATVSVVGGALDEGATFFGLAQNLAHTVRSERRARFDVQLALIKLSVARWRGDFDAAVEAMRAVEEILATQPLSEWARGDELRARALQNLGIAELWSSRFAEARHHLEEALALARRAELPYLEIDCLGHLGIAGPPTGMSCRDALKLADEARAIAEQHRWADDPVTAAASATGVVTLACLGRFDEAEEWLAQAENAQRSEGDPGTRLMLHFARGLLCQAKGRLHEALAAFGASLRMQAFLPSEHAITATVRSCLLQARAQIGEPPTARAALSDLGADRRGNVWMRITVGVVHLAEGNPEKAVEALEPVIEGCAPGLHNCLTVIGALLLDAAAHEQLRDRPAAEASIERALELAEPEGIVLPFLLAPVRDLLEHYPPHRTAHAALLRTIRDVIAGSSARPRGNVSPLLQELSEAELRVVRFLPSNLKVPEIASELYLSPHTVRTHIRHIYVKLDVHNRNEAVAHARELGLLARGR